LDLNLTEEESDKEINGELNPVKKKKKKEYQTGPSPRQSPRPTRGRQEEKKTGRRRKKAPPREITGIIGLPDSVYPSSIYLCITVGRIYGMNYRFYTKKPVFTSFIPAFSRYSMSTRSLALAPVPVASESIVTTTKQTPY
jgi:hypothetical protein